MHRRLGESGAVDSMIRLVPVVSMCMLVARDMEGIVRWESV